jgi:hypothetical protein
VKKLRTQPSLVLTAETGAGKTTQVPQWIIDHVLEGSRRKCAVLVPTRTIARGLAAHIANIRGGDVGDLIGYAVGNGDVKKGKMVTVMTYVDSLSLSHVIQTVLWSRTCSLLRPVTPNRYSRANETRSSACKS